VTDTETTDKAIYMLTCLPNGIQRMSPDVDGLVQTSLNMGILKKVNDKVILTFCVRSSVASEKDMLKRRLADAMKIAGGEVLFEGEYPGWQYRTESRLRDLMEKVYTEQYGSDPVIEAVHAGVECGFFADKLSGLDCVSIGPDLSEIHTYRESMNIPSVGRTYSLVLETLKRLATRG
jgi:dipeptidase D